MEKKKGASDLSRAERLEIEILLGKGYSQRSIATALGRGRNTISYEILLNSTNSVCNAKEAHNKARVRKRMRKLQYSKIEEYPEIKKFVIEKLEAHWNPDEIAGYLKRTKDPRYVSKTAIYKWLRTSRGERYCTHLYSGRKYVKKRKSKAKREMIPDRVGIERRDESVNDRKEVGNWERDSVVSKKGCLGGAATHQERTSRFFVAVKVESMRCEEHATATQHVYSYTVMLSMTTDNGIENRAHKEWGMPVFFCDPYSSWQKGGIENANKMLRAFFPKGTDFSKVTQKEIDDACDIINNKPRKILGYRSAREVAEEMGLFKNTGVLIQG
jgi:transposase, IS30 family